uniref:C2H2-type domain-containing protein n=1 Tax=Fusarium oxysporum (strain Fo5176) TaxID=660025 RepID=A0A0D2XP58_FUSOF
MNTIADHVSACLQEFNSLCSSPTIWTDSIPDEGTQSDISLVKLQNELSRFKIWSGNIGAHRKGRSSLDHRLQDASNIRDQLVELLEDLRESLQDDGASGNSELSQIFAAIVEDINCLFRLSVSIHNPSPHDRFKKACLTDTSGYEPFDVQHVCNKLSKAPKPIAERLGKAISRRRQYFKYRELHHDKLASGLELDDKDQMQNLFPYICVELGCPAPDQDFQRRHQWADHVKKHHWKTWACKLGCDKTFDSSQDIKRHLEHKHSETAEMTHLDSLLTICERPKSENEPADCPLCGERQSSFKQYQRHVGRHQEDLALFALPHLPGEEDEKNDESGFESEEQEELESVVEEKLEKASSYVTRLSDESGDKAPAAAEHSPRYSRLVGVATADVTDGITYDTTFTNVIAGPGYWQSGSHSWTCPIPSCLYHDHGWPTEEQRDRHYSDKHSETSIIYGPRYDQPAAGNASGHGLPR